MRKPNCIIIGCQKCGTTALKKYMAQHPDVFMTKNEVHYFDQKKKLPIEWYCSLFNDRKEKIVGEKTPAYCYFKEIPKQIAELNPNCKIIMCVRDPVARAYSEYQMRKLSGEVRGKWEKVWNTRNYLSRGLYAEQLRNILKSFPKEQVLIIKTGNLYSNREETVKSVFHFLNIDEEFIPPQLKDYHKGGTGRFKSLEYAARFFILLRRFFRQFKWGWWLDDFFHYFVMYIKEVNKKKGYKQMSKKMQIKLQEYYKEPNEEFKRMTGIGWEYED